MLSHFNHVKKSQNRSFLSKTEVNLLVPGALSTNYQISASMSSVRTDKEIWIGGIIRGEEEELKQMIVITWTIKNGNSMRTVSSST